MGDLKMSSLAKGLQVIQQFAYEKETWGVREIAKRLGLSKSTAFRLLQALCDQEFLAINQETKKYEIGSDLWRLGVALRGKETLHATAMSAIRKYADAVNEMMGFFRYGHGGVIYEGIAECDHALRFGLRLGIPYGIDKGPAGKILLAFLPLEETSKIYKKLEEDPSTDIETLKKHVKQVRDNGYCSTKGERTAGITGFAAPIMGPRNVLLGGVGLYVPDARYKPKERQKYIHTVKACAGEISSIVNPRGSAETS